MPIDPLPIEQLTREVLGNIDTLSMCLMYALATVSLGIFSWGVWRRVRLWRLGQSANQRVSWSVVASRLLTEVLLQKKVRSGRRGAGRAHLLLFGGFVVLFIGTVLIAIEHYGGALFGYGHGNPLFHKGLYFVVYEFVLDTAGLALLAGCFWFALRRLRANSSMEHTWVDWLVLGLLATIAVTGYFTEGLRIVREQTPYPAISYVGWAASHLLTMLGTTPSNVSVVHLTLWWTHTVLAFGLIAAFPFTRLFHVIAGAASLATADTQHGVMTLITMEEIEETGLIGVGEVQHFSTRKLLELDACVSCGRCQDACPAHEAGKPLSPRDVVQGLRTHLNEVGPGLLAAEVTDGEASGTPLIGEIISQETAWSCTTCHACAEVCPLGVNPMGLITDMRRSMIGEGQLRGSAAVSLQKMQRSGNPWGLPASERFAWAEGLDIPTVEEHPDFEILYWVGCAASYDRRLQRVARSVVQLLRAAGVNFAVLGSQERCTGESARRMGDEFLFQELAQINLDTLQKHRVRKIVTHCPHCLNSFKNDYPQLGGQFEVIHHSQLLMQLVEEGKLPEATESRQGTDSKVTFHDPCYLARVDEEVEAPRKVLASTNMEPLTEVPRNGQQTACCGAGGGRMWFDDAADERIGRDRVDELLATGANTLAVACPFCLTMLKDGVAAKGSEVEVVDIAELLAQALDSNAT